MHLIIEIMEALFIVSAAVMTIYLIRHYIFTLNVLRSIRKNGESITAENVPYEPPVSIFIPARNEERVLGRLLRAITELTYPKNKTQIIIINDASTDNTGAIADEYAEAYSHVKVIHRDKEHGGRGKAAALNDGMKYANGEVIFCFDADYYPQKDILEKLTREFADPKVGVVQGRITVLNEPQNMVTRLVALERIGGYCVDQKARDNLGLITQFGGTVGGIRRSLLERLGGWDENILAEDTDLTFRVYLAGYKVRYVQCAECYEEAVESWRAYWKQRYRWAKGHMQCAFKHSLALLKSSNLRLREKIDGFLLLNVYFMPILALLSLITGVPLFFLRASQYTSILWTVIPFSLYSFVGNFAPFFEVGIGAYLDSRTRAQWLIPLLIFTFLYNIPICTKALLDLLTSKITRNNSNHWTKTRHSGNGNSYIKS
jgi:cellulose synthase/poly-beta-1,6-N-acetylglucosamine synthase-like glycosyltransferase